MKNSCRYLSLALLCVLALNSCKKDEDTTYYESLSGKFSISLPRYIDCHSTEEFVIRPGGVSRNDGGGVGYFFNSPYRILNDTTRYENDSADIVGEYVFKLESDSLGSFTLQAGAFAKGYSTSYAYATFTTVDDALNIGSIKGFTIYDGEGVAVDARDGRTYHLASVSTGSGTLIWMRQNLAFAQAGTPYAQYEVMTDIFGRYYTPSEAREGICPQGWRLPSVEEWESVFAKYGNLGALYEDITFNGDHLWEYRPGIEMTNRSLLSIMPCGYMVKGDVCRFDGFKSYAAFLTSDIDESGNPLYVYFNKDSNEIFSAIADSESFGCSVRCVREQ